MGSAYYVCVCVESHLNVVGRHRHVDIETEWDGRGKLLLPNSHQPACQDKCMYLDGHFEQLTTELERDGFYMVLGLMKYH